MPAPTIVPSIHSFLSQAAKLQSGSWKGGCIPVFARLSADYETPLSAYQKIQDGSYSFLLESAESSGDGGRYSIIGSRPLAVLEAFGKKLTWKPRTGNVRSWEAKQDVLHEVESILKKYQSSAVESDSETLPPFTGGAVGYLGFDCVSQFEPSVGTSPPDQLGLPDAVWMIASEIVVFDHLSKQIYVIVNAVIEEDSDLEAVYAEACTRLKSQVARLDAALPFRHFDTLAKGSPLTPESNTTQQQYQDMVQTSKEYIGSGDIFQVVPSQRFAVPFSGSPTDLHRALRQVNPSPYMFCIEFGDSQNEGFALVGSSPEVHVRLTQGKIEIRPIAGTRHRGKNVDDDNALEQELLADPKERAEHVMLVDLARNDVGQIAQSGSVVVDDFMIVERYSHVMHIVSNVSGQIAEDKTACDVLRATFPAGTVSGSPKVRALQIINELEVEKRGPYAGAVGWIGFDGELDSCIALRTAIVKNGNVYIQAGAGVVADSDPQAEWQETVNKASGMVCAVAQAEEIAQAKQQLR